MSLISIHKLNQKIDFHRVRKNTFSLKKDCFGQLFHPSPEVFFGVDQTHFHFYARHQETALIHPNAREGDFQAELWKYDVAEFFLAAPDRSQYLEFNLAPNGAWWSCFFSAPRKTSRTKPLAGVSTQAKVTLDDWQVHAAIPLTEIPWPLEECFLNATFILKSPDQQFLTLTDLGGDQPDFHRPAHFLAISLSS